MLSAQDEAVREMRASMEEELRTQSQKLAACEANLFRAQEEVKSAKVCVIGLPPYVATANAHASPPPPSDYHG